MDTLRFPRFNVRTIGLVLLVIVAALLLGHVLAFLLPLVVHGGAMTFIGQAKKRNQILGSIVNDQGANVPRRLDLRNAGYLDRLRLYQSYDFQFGTASPGAADAFAQAGGQLNRVTVQSNSVGLLFDCSGEMTKVISAIDDVQRVGVGVLDPSPNRFVSAPAQLATTNVWSAEIPIGLYFNNKPWPIGLYQMALNALEVSLEVRFRPLVATVGVPGSGLYAAGSSTTAVNVRGDLQIQQQYYDPIADPASQPTLAFIHQWREFQIPITADGDLDIRLPPSNLYMRMLYWVVSGAAAALTPTNSILTKLQLRYGANFAPYEERGVTDFTNNAFTNVMRGGQILNRMNRLYGNMFGAAGAGPYDSLYVHDFFTENNNEQDFINSAATTELRATLTTAAGTYSGGAYVKVATEQLIPLVVPSTGSGNVQGTN